MTALRFAVAVLCSAASFAQTPAAAKTGEAVQRGRTQFAQTCGFCHGREGTGGAEGPNLVRSALVRHDENGNLIAPVIHNGRPQKGMPAVPLNESQIADVAAFLHSRIEESDRRSPGDPRDRDLKLLMTGDAKAGKDFFYGTGGCSACHSPTGDLSGVAKKYAPADLQARFLYPSGVHKRAAVTMRSGKQVAGTLFYQDQFTIAIKDDAGWYRSWPLSDVSVRIEDPVAAHAKLLHTYREADVHNMFAFLESLR